MRADLRAVLIGCGWLGYFWAPSFWSSRCSSRTEVVKPSAWFPNLVEAAEKLPSYEVRVA